jgi:hypothetical protein
MLAGELLDPLASRNCRRHNFFGDIGAGYQQHDVLVGITTCSATIR